MYSRWEPAPGVGKIRLKNPERLRNEHMWWMGEHVAGRIERNTWVVWERDTGIVEAIFYSEPNVHGWSAAEAHAKLFINRYSEVNPFDLDSIP